MEQATLEHLLEIVSQDPLPNRQSWTGCDAKGIISPNNGYQVKCPAWRTSPVPKIWHTLTPARLHFKSDKGAKQLRCHGCREPLLADTRGASSHSNGPGNQVPEMLCDKTCSHSLGCCKARTAEAAIPACNKSGDDTVCANFCCYVDRQQWTAKQLEATMAKHWERFIPPPVRLADRNMWVGNGSQRFEITFVEIDFDLTDIACSLDLACLLFWGLWGLRGFFWGNTNVSAILYPGPFTLVSMKGQILYIYHIVPLMPHECINQFIYIEDQRIQYFSTYFISTTHLMLEASDK